MKTTSTLNLHGIKLYQVILKNIKEWFSSGKVKGKKKYREKKITLKINKTERHP